MLFFLATSIFYVGLDLGFDIGAKGVLPPRGLTALQALAGAGVVASAVYYLFAWQGVPPADAPSTTALAAEYLNVFASLLYVGATWVGFAVDSQSAFDALYILQLLSNVLYFIDAALYSRAWWTEIQSLPPRPRRGCDVRDANFIGNVTNVLASTLYVIASAVPYVLDIDGDQGFGRLVRGNTKMRYATEVGDFVYLACALACFAGYWQDAADADIAATEAARNGASVRNCEPGQPPFNVLQPLRDAPTRLWRLVRDQMAELLRKKMPWSASPVPNTPRFVLTATPTTKSKPSAITTVVANPLAIATVAANSLTAGLEQNGTLPRSGGGSVSDVQRTGVAYLPEP